MDQLQGMRVFVRVVEANSFTVAAKHLGMSAATVARNLNKLEAHLNVRLLVRTTRSLSLTAAGERYIEDCRAMIQMLDNVEARLDGL